MDQLREVEYEAKALPTMTQKRVLTDENCIRAINDLSGDGNIESMLSVEMDCLKLEDVLLALANNVV
ncbi:unnamed protein product [Lactuca virosa]|uniref:Uncharacterized protein n=1 Tax=Lactuca virosa TaxID=75947 RepID=A0AAU9P103_9ASTR|nr:unnamed protein product [Lactuca virosa]